ncbi:Protein of unknown function [Bacillus thuringiensis]|uniref:Uncharacterized protein n=1 Tax=Bacillus thuringiensis TaxID=1428 RepID=A0A1C4A5C7_BACTU|nr:Protein of unknown function [Bacillus thuringiensis]SCL84336.1 Protein of unknown function [Bacillus wiedmannii]
MEKKKQSMLH